MNIIRNKKIVVFIILLLMVANTLLFAKTVSLSDSIVKIEQETQRYKIDNRRLEQKMFSLNSLKRLDRVADYLGFTKNAQMLALPQQQYASLGMSQ